jgi:pimeloyl-ACP methyl ester carboxylesterase
MGCVTTRRHVDRPVRLREATLKTRDGLAISAAHLPPLQDTSTGIVVIHGFGGSWRQERVLRVMEHLGEHGGVIGLDMRGHGQSEGATTLAHDEPLDVEAATRWARDLGYQRVVTVGFSMGGAVALRHAGLICRGPETAGTDAVVSVSAPAFWYYRGTPPMRWLHRAVMNPLGRGYLRAAMGTRVDPTPWPEPGPLPPVGALALAREQGLPVLIVHGDADAFFPLEHPEALAGAAPGVQTWIEPGFGHAEGAIEIDLLRRIGAWTAER